VDLHDRPPSALSEADRAPEPVVKLGGRYRLTSLISRGGLADIWKAEDEVLGRPVVAKLLRPELLADGAIKRLFRVEALAAARLSHANIISVFDTGEHKGVPFLVMEYLGGGSLREILDNGPIHPLRAAEWGGEICAALAHAHQAGIIHRDIRPENILFTETGHLKVTDFAIAKAAFENPEVASSATGANSAYACPERDPDGRGDLYSLGVVLFECLIGATPDRARARVEPEGESPPAVLRPGSLRPGIPMELDAAVLKLLARDPAKRFPSALALRSTLQGLLEEQAPSPAAPPPPPAPRVAPRKVHRPRGKTPVAPARAPRDSFLRTEGRWLLPTLLVIAAAVAVALTVPSVRSGIDRVINAPDAGTGGGEGAVEIVRGFDYDPPPGDGRENSGRTGLAFDRNPSTTWATTSYRTPDFGRLKDGVGLAFDLGDARELSGVRVTSVAGGWEGSLRFSEDGKSWSSPEEGQSVDSDHTFQTSGSHRYWMVWITNLVRTPGEGTSDNVYAVAIREVQPLTD
jgi:eukaryotic-like serine/threonine-protein kinase